MTGGARWAIVAVLAAACTDSATAPEQCTPTSSLTPTARQTSSVVFDWTPKCPVAMVLVELRGGADQWVVAAPFFSEASTEVANILAPPITYGVTPAGAEVLTPAASLVAGQTYTVILWRVVPANAQVQCEIRVQNACLIAFKEFTR